MEYTKKTYPEISDEILDTCRKSLTPGTYEERISLWKKINAALRGEGTPFDISKAWEKIYQNSEAFQEANELVENARSAEREKKDREIQVNIIFAWIGMRLIILFLAYFFIKIFYLKIIIPFLEWWDGVVVWFFKNQIEILFWVGGVILFLICYKIFPIVKPKK